MVGEQRASGLRLALFLVACLGVFVLLYSLSGGRTVPGKHGYRVEAIVPDALGLSKNADVRQAGVQIGKVTDSRFLGSTTALMLELDDGHAPVYRDATVLVRTKSVAGENYLELDPGRPRAGSLPDGGRLRIGRSREATQLDEILSVLDRDRRRQLQRALDGLGGGLDGRGGDLNRLLESSSTTVRSAAPVSRTLAGDRQQLAGLVDSFGRTSRALGDRRQAIGVLVRQAKASAEAVEDRDAQLDTTLATLPGFLTQARTTAGRLERFSGEATPVVRDLRLAVRDLTPAVEALRTAAPAGRRVVRELRPFARAVRPPVAALRPFSDATSGAIPPLAATLRQANPMLGHLSGYSRELPTAFGTLGGATKYTDTVGHLGRLALLFGRGSVPGTVPLEQLQQFREVESFGVNAYPAPGEAGQGKPFTGKVPRIEAEAPYGVGGE